VSKFNLKVNGQARIVDSHPDTPLLFILRNKLKLKGVKHGCGSEQCGACKVIIDGQAVPTCKLPVKNVQGLAITTIEGLGSPENLHHLQQAFIEEQAFQCGYCTPGMIIAAAGLLNRTRYPSDDEIREALKNNLCRCGVYDRVRRAIKLSTGREESNAKYEVQIKPLEIPDFNHLPSTLIRTPDLDSWLRINIDQTITVFTGKVELGQGIKTAVAMIVAEELDVSPDRILVADTDSRYSPDEGLTVSSMSLETTGEALRWAAADARQIMLSVAMEELEAQPDHLEIADGIIRDASSGKSTDYWQLFGGKPFSNQVSGHAKPKPADQYSILGQGNYRLDSTAKVCGTSNFVHDLDLPGMVHGRVLRTTNQSAKLAAFDQQKMQGLPGLLQIVQDGSFIGIICEQEQQAIDALATLEQSVKWQQPDLPPGQDQIYDDLLNQAGRAFLVKQGTPVEDPIPPIEIPGKAAQTLQAAYYRPFQMHASLGPSAAAALLCGDNLTLWLHSQGVYPIRAAIARVLGMQTDQIHVIHVEGAGCYGHNGADDAALDAALLARACPGRPVLLKWTRENEHTWEPYGPAMVINLQASLDTSGAVLDWNHDIWSYPHLGRGRSAESTSGLLAAWQLGQPFSKPALEPVLAPHVGSHRNADPLYKFPRKRIVKHFIPETPLRTSALRSLGAFANVFAIESFADELAHAAGLDPVGFRLKYLQDERARAVIQAAADKVGWGDSKQQGAENHGWGIAFAQYKNRQCYAAVAVEVRVNLETGQINLEQAVIAADAGQIVSADGLSNQLEGSFTQAASWTLYEQVTFNQQGITSCDWDTYPILKINQAPRIKILLINRPGLPFLGAGEAAQGPTPAAIANAIFNATGLRLRKIPFTPSVVKSALQHPDAD
jgi:nicotinate dehydrogenase subunit B